MDLTVGMTESIFVSMKSSFSLLDLLKSSGHFTFTRLRIVDERMLEVERD
jgi:hypothetical protein